MGKSKLKVNHDYMTGRLVAVFSVPLVVMVALGTVTFRLWQAHYSEQLYSTQVELVNRGAVLMSRELGQIQHIAGYVASSLEYYRTPEHYESTDDWKKAVAEYFVQVQALSPHISQIRWLSPQGQELIRVNINNQDAYVVPSGELQDKSNRYYFLQGMRSESGKVVLSPIDLNVEYGGIVRPYEITVRASHKLHGGQGEELGLLVVNYNLNYLFSRLRALQTPTNTLELINLNGEWLLSEQPELEWLHLYDDHLSSFSNIYPATWSQLEQTRTLTESRFADKRPYTSLPSYLTEDFNGESKYFFISAVRADVWQSKQTLTLFFMVLAGVLGYMVMMALGMLLWRLSHLRREHVLQIESEN